MILQTIAIDDIVIEARKRPVDPKTVTEIAKSIEHQGLLQSIGVKQLENGYRLVFGAHRIGAVRSLGWKEISCMVFPESASDEECLLAEIQENKARKELTGTERKAFAAEVGRLISKLQEDFHLSNGKNPWLVEMEKSTGTPAQTIRNWFTAFCKDRGLSITPAKATVEQQEDFFTWLDEQRQAEIEEQHRIEEEEKNRRREIEHKDLVEYLDAITKEFGPVTVKEWVNGWLWENLAKHQE